MKNNTVHKSQDMLLGLPLAAAKTAILGGLLGSP
jgi:hypothetical protein